MDRSALRGERVGAGMGRARVALRRLDGAVPILFKVGVPLLVVAGLTAVVTGSVLIRNTRDQFAEAYEAHTRSVAYLVAEQYREYGDNPIHLGSLLEDLHETDPMLHRLRVYHLDQGGLRLFASSGEGGASPEPTSVLPEVRLPVGTPSSPAWLGLMVSSEGVDAAVAHARGQLLGVLAVGVTASQLCASLILYALVLRRARRLARAAKRVAGGDLSVRLPERDLPAGRDSLRNVAREFGRMIEVVHARTDALERAERRYRTLVEQLPVIVYVDENDDAATPVYVSPHHERALGYTAHDVLAEPEIWQRMLHPEDRDRVLAAHLESNRSGRPFKCDYRLIAKDGRVVWIHDEANLLDDMEGKRRWQGIQLDVTDQKEAEEALHRLDRQNRSILEAAAEGIWGLDTQGRVIFVNPAAAAMTGWTSEELMGRNTHDLLHHTREDGTPYPLSECPIYRTVSDGTEEHVVGELLWRRDGSCFPVEYRSAPVLEEGRQAGTVVVFSDITERARSEDALRAAYEREREAAERLRSVDEMKNAFLSAVSHELRTPLAAVMGYAQTLEHNDEMLEPGDRSDILKRLSVNATKLHQLLADLLDLDRMARGILEPQRSAVDVADLVLRVSEEAEMPGRRVTVNAVPVIAELDGPKVERIVENLITNAAKYTPAASTVQVTVRQDNAGILLVVDDEGPGVPDELKEAVFEPFQRGPDAPRVAPGTGIGLSLVARFAELHGGRAWVEDRPGGGASFRVSLPAFAQPVETQVAPAGAGAP